jgi:hypothetical protein
MARLSRAEFFDPSEIVAVHTTARTNRRCFLMGDDQFTDQARSRPIPFERHFLVDTTALSVHRPPSQW